MKLPEILVTVSLLVILASCSDSSGPAGSDREGEFWADSLTVTVKKEFHEWWQEERWFAYIDCRYGLVTYSGTIDNFELYFLEPAMGSVGLDFNFIRGCNIPCGTIEYLHQRMDLFTLDFTDCDSLYVKVAIRGCFQICPVKWPDYPVHLGLFAWSDTIYAHVEH